MTRDEVLAKANMILIAADQNSVSRPDVALAQAEIGKAYIILAAEMRHQPYGGK